MCKVAGVQAARDEYKGGAKTGKADVADEVADLGELLDQLAADDLAELERMDGQQCELKVSGNEGYE